jgi:demethylmenaquinone methyltransferase/2-methoxy-6-polyprenyl-1,4-benzoquinol methylase
MQDKQPQPAAGGTADFGFTQVPVAEKAVLVRGVFDRVARRYDLMNDLLSFSAHRLWKRIFINAVNPRPGDRVLDLAGGTGDIAFKLRERGADVVLTDINPAMLGVGRDRALDRGLADIPVIAADAEHLPFRDGGFDAVTIAFGLRNCTDKSAVLREARRVLRPGGKFFCLEFSRLEVAALAPLYDAYSFRVLPWLGGRVARDAESYRYLAESIRTFPPQAELARMLGEAGLKMVAHRNLSGGVVAIHSGRRL